MLENYGLKGSGRAKRVKFRGVRDGKGKKEFEKCKRKT
jgi:hypothetical protein